MNRSELRALAGEQIEHWGADNAPAPVTASALLALLDRLEEAEALLRDVDACGVEWQNEGRYRTIQLDLPTGDAIRAFLAEDTP